LLIAFGVPVAIFSASFLFTLICNRLNYSPKSIRTRWSLSNLLRPSLDWEEISYIPEHIRLKLLGYQNSGGLIAYRRAICGAEYEPGTFRVSEIDEGVTFLKRALSYDAWVTSELAAELITLRNRYSNILGELCDTELTKRAKDVLDARTDMGHPLRHEIWYQEYSDVLRRILLFCAGSDPDIELELFPNLTFQRKNFVLEVIKWLETHENPSLRKWLHLSIAAGLLGVNEKSPHTATSEINALHAIPLDSRNEMRSISIQRVGQQVNKLAGLVHNSDQLTSGCLWRFRKTLVIKLKYWGVRG
jgi:hypothetical protein